MPRQYQNQGHDDERPWHPAPAPPPAPSGLGAALASRRPGPATGPLEISAADLAELRQAARDLREVFAAGDASAAAERINVLLAGRARPPRLTTHGGGSGWHLHVDSGDDAPWAEWFLTSSCLALAVLLAERQAPRPGCAHLVPAASRS
jgi:hypothetical protein